MTSRVEQTQRPGIADEKGPPSETFRVFVGEARLAKFDAGDYSNFLMFQQIQFLSS